MYFYISTCVFIIIWGQKDSGRSRQLCAIKRLYPWENNFFTFIRVNPKVAGEESSPRPSPRPPPSLNNSRLLSGAQGLCYEPTVNASNIPESRDERQRERLSITLKSRNAVAYVAFFSIENNDDDDEGRLNTMLHGCVRAFVPFHSHKPETRDNHVAIDGWITKEKYKSVCTVKSRIKNLKHVILEELEAMTDFCFPQHVFFDLSLLRYVCVNHESNRVAFIYFFF